MARIVTITCDCTAAEHSPLPIITTVTATIGGSKATWKACDSCATGAASLLGGAAGQRVVSVLAKLRGAK